MLSEFLTPIEWLAIGDYPGRIGRCRFELHRYQDALFSAAAIPFPEHLTPAVPKRRAEFLAGRHLACQVLAALGHDGVIVARGDDRAPIWPPGVAGALSHNSDTALCAVHHEPGLGGVGLDVETLLAPERAEALWEGIVGGAEYAWLCEQPMAFNALLTLVFSAKESLFKALYPQVRRYFDFHAARLVALDCAGQRFELELLETLTAHCRAGRRFTGHFFIDCDNVTTFIHL